MIRFLKEQKFILAFVASLFIFHWFSKDITDPYERPIGGDAQAYYAYLPAFFIYQDLDYGFMETHAQKHYPVSHIKDFIYEVDGQKVNKTFPGVAVLYAPFFFAAHLSAKLFGFEADGFSSIYQFWFDIGLWTYFLLGLIFMRKLLEKLQFSSKIAHFCVILIGIGTNVFFYTVYDQSVTHIFNFFMINAMLLCLAIYGENKKFSHLILAAGLLALIGITRPTNIIVFLLIFAIFYKKETILDIIYAIFSKKAWKIGIVVLPILALPFLLWKVQTGNWIVYSYGEEGFDFAHPHFFEFLFSYTKGWMTYTPLAAIILLTGLFAVFKKSRKQGTIILIFYILSVYIFSSWWCWYYGAGMSQRVMIDHYVLLAILAAHFLKLIWDKKMLRNSFMALTLVLSLFNIAQAYQIKHGILQFGSATKQQYWDNFLVFDLRARVYPKDHWELIEEKNVSDETWLAAVGVNEEYSQSCNTTIQELRVGSKLMLEFEAKAAGEIEQTRAVLLLHPKTDTSLEIGFPIFLKEYVKNNEWVKMQFLIEPTENFVGDMSVFFWNAGTGEQVEIRNVRYVHYYSEEYF